MPVTPTGPMSLPLHYLRETLINCAAFQAWCAAPGDATVARNHAFVVGIPDVITVAAQNDEGITEISRLTPLAMIDLYRPWMATPKGGRAWRSEKIAGGGSNVFRDGGRLDINFLDTIDESDAHGGGDYESALNAFENNVGAVIADLRSQSGKPGYLNITGVEQMMHARRAEQGRALAFGDSYSVTITVDWSS